MIRHFFPVGTQGHLRPIHRLCHIGLYLKYKPSSAITLLTKILISLCILMLLNEGFVVCKIIFSDVNILWTNTLQNIYMNIEMTRTIRRNSPDRLQCLKI